MIYHLSAWLLSIAWLSSIIKGNVVKIADQVFGEAPTPRRSSDSAPTSTSNSYLYTDSALEATPDPSLFPSQLPSVVPSLSPTTFPVMPSTSPSFVSSAAPSQTPSQVINYECVDLGSLSSADMDQNIWFSYNFDSGYTGSLSVWPTFVAQLQQLRLTTTPSELMYVTLSDDCFTPSAKRTSFPSQFPLAVANVATRSEKLFSIQRCREKSTVFSIWTSLTTSKDFAIGCGYNIWSGYTSGGNYLVSMNNTRSISSRFILGISMRSNMLSWPEWYQKSTAGVDSVTIDYNLSFPGILYCAVYPQPAPLLATSLSIWQARFRASVSVYDGSQLTGTLAITGLAPNTNYVVYCFTEGFWNDADSTERSPLEATLSAANSVKTALPLENIIDVNVPFISTIQGMATATMSVSPSFLSSNISLIPKLSYVGSTYCSASLDPNALSASALTVNDSTYVLVPQVLLFGPMNPVKSIDVFLKTQLSGCYVLSFTSVVDVSSSNITETHINFNSPIGLFSNMLLINSTENPSYSFAVISARFTSDGLGIDIRFSDNSDRGAALRLPPTFPCSRILNFTSAAASSCWFDRAFLLRAMLPAGDVSLPFPGETIVLRANSIKPACSLLPVGSDCSILDFMQESSLELNGDTVIPTAVVAAPMQVAVGQDLTLDISLSSGNGGRPWKAIRWTVASNYSLESATFSTLALQDLMNNGSMAWTHCVPDTYSCNRIPRGYLSQAGVYSFVLSIRNFVGRWATAACTVRVVSDPVPSVYIFGPSVSTLFTNQTTIIRSVVTTNEKLCSTFSISWLIYENGLLRPNLQSTNPRYRDSRTVVIDPFTLNPGSEYSFSVMVVCGAYSSMDQVTRYISPCEAVAILRNGNAIVASLTNPIVFDASKSYMSCISGVANDTNYQWSCVQRTPLNESGCNAFYWAINTLGVYSSSIVFNDPATVFVPGVTYAISVRVSSAQLGVSDVTSQSLTILGNADLRVPVVRILEKRINIDGSYRQSLDGYVTSSSSVLAEWALTTTNRTIVSRILFEGNMHYFPAVFPPELVMGSSSFTFRLRAMPITDFCNDFKCASPAVVSSSSMRVFVNQPPSSGMLAVSPSVGFDDLLFTLSAQNWHDDNLPLFYTFHQSVYDPDLDYYLIRNRMQVPFVSTTLTVIGQRTNTVQLRLWVFDILFARAEAYSAVMVYERIQNVTVTLQKAEEASAIVQQLRNPEILLPSLNSIVSLSENCTHGDAYFCMSVAEAGSEALSVSVDKFNAGTSLLHGMSSYLKSLAKIDALVLLPVSSSLIEVYNYLISASRAVGFKVDDGSYLVDRLLESCDSLVNLLQLRGEAQYGVSADDVLAGGDEVTSRKLKSVNSEETIDIILQSIYTLISDYFRSSPFGYAETMQSSSFLNVSMIKRFWDEVAEARRNLDFDEALSISSPQFISSVTAAYSSLVISNTASYYHSNGANKTKVLHTRYFDFSLSSSLQSVAATLSLELPVDLIEEPPSLTAPVKFFNQTNNSSIVTFYRQCNDTSQVVCPSSVTRGPTYVFPAYVCEGSNSSVVVYSCPLYNSTLYCIDNDASASYPIVERTNANFRCEFPVLLTSDAESSEMQPSVAIKGTYSVVRQYLELSSASLVEASKPTAKPAFPPTSDILPALSNDNDVSYFAIIGIGIAGIAFVAFIYNR
eukprot:gene29681-35826_t